MVIVITVVLRGHDVKMMFLLDFRSFVFFYWPQQATKAQPRRGSHVCFHLASERFWFQTPVLMDINVPEWILGIPAGSNHHTSMTFILRFQTIPKL